MQHEAKQHHIYVVDYLLHGPLRVINLHPIFKVCNISYLCVLFHSSWLLLTFWCINHEKIKGKYCFHVTISTSCIKYEKKNSTKKAPLLDIWFCNWISNYVHLYPHNFLVIYFRQFSYKWLVISGRHSISRYQGYLYHSYILCNEILHECWH